MLLAIQNNFMKLTIVYMLTLNTIIKIQIYGMTAEAYQYATDNLISNVGIMFMMR